MYIQANPTKGKSQQEKDEIKQRYTLGDQVLPKLSRARKNSAEEADMRLIEEARQLSLREVGLGTSESRVRITGHRDSSDHRDSRLEEERRQRRRDQDRRRRNDVSSAIPIQVTRSASQVPTDSPVRARQIEHQSSLRSLISSSDFDSSEIDEEVLRQIIDDLLNAGLDLDNLSSAQEEELTDRIASALRKGRKPESEDTRPSMSRESTQSSQRSERDQSHHRRHGPTSTIVDQPAQPSHTPVSRPHHLQTPSPSYEGRQMSSSDYRRQTSPAAINSWRKSAETRRSATGPATHQSDSSRASNHRRRPTSSQGTASRRASSDLHIQAARSATDLSSPPPSSPPERTQSLDTTDHKREIAGSARQREENPESIRDKTLKTDNHNEIHSMNDMNSRNMRTPLLPLNPPKTTLTTTASPQSQTIAIEDPRRQLVQYPSDEPSATHKFSSAISSAGRLEPSDPLINCHRCDKPRLEHELHLNCPICLGGSFNLCTRCYRQGYGCLYWYGFGFAASQRYERQAPRGGYPPDHVPPHVLIGHRYIDVPPTIHGALEGESARGELNAKKKILQSGAFCSKCDEFADSCFWKCDFCNEGEWGFCNRCVHQGKCCSHPLLPMAHISTQITSDFTSSPHKTQLSPHPINGHDSQSSLYYRNTFPRGCYIPLNLSKKCNICKCLIPAPNTHFHCPQCNDGDYDVCKPCYLNFSHSCPENGSNGWRRCPNSHRMIAIEFREFPGGQRRVIVDDLVGGHALKEDNPDSQLSEQPHKKDDEFSWRDGHLVQVHTISRQQPPASASPGQKFPPNGGSGMRVLALWSYWAAPDSVDELEFPKGALLSEVENINGDWFWGIYAGAKGLFPGNYVRILEDVMP